MDRGGPELRVLSGAVIAAAIDVHRQLGPGFTESVYEEALSVELAERRMPFERQKAFEVLYRGKIVGEGRTDFVIDRQLVVELKAVDSIVAVHRAQVLSYLKALGLSLGLLINFKVDALRTGVHRIIRSDPSLSSAPLCSSAPLRS